MSKVVCRFRCPWAAGCSCPGSEEQETDACQTARFLALFWKTPEALNEWERDAEMRHKYEDEGGEDCGSACADYW